MEKQRDDQDGKVRAATIPLNTTSGSMQVPCFLENPARQIHLNLGVCVTYIKIAPEPNGFWLENSVFGDINRKVHF